MERIQYLIIALWFFFIINEDVYWLFDCLLVILGAFQLFIFWPLNFDLKRLIWKNIKHCQYYYISNLKREVETLKKEKNEIFKTLKLPSNYLEPHFNCPICKDTGYVFNGNSSHMCNCLKQKIFDIEYNKSSIGLENFTNFNLNLYSNTADEKKYDS